MRVNYLAQEHNAVPQPGLEPGPSDPESNALTIRSLRLPLFFFKLDVRFSIFHSLAPSTMQPARSPAGKQ